MIAIGYTSSGKCKEFNWRTSILDCKYLDLISLEIYDGDFETLDCRFNSITNLVIPKGIKKLFCFNNIIEELILPEGIKKVWCFNNKIKELILPDSLEYLSCINNNLTELTIPKNSQYIYCDRNVKGLDKINWNCDIKLY